ncbi:YoaK family protein [Limoniibacter endophyticus]|uniref:DUF1275 domain-containing protein n=1 Tax=Limoniibacter endophyticus TaxID=1565040 RepID=A0A8J3DJZ1_9HYPH|nr:YoaK family protein [Limoniibacter endophyticus]GHC74895.1 hypothetical protein GCM10010136_24200 [Limoniibacter endophyticus]
MLILEGENRTRRVDVALAAVFAGIAGAINAAGFQAAGFFSANMTGNASSFADYVALGKLELMNAFAALIAAFILGAFLAGMMIEIGRKRRIATIYTYCILLEALILAALSMHDIYLARNEADIVLVLGLSFVMGLQNATTTRLTDARVRTTHVSGMATDLGLNAARLLTSPRNNQETANRVILHSSTFVAFVTGGILGAGGHILIGNILFAMIATALLFLALVTLRRARLQTRKL